MNFDFRCGLQLALSAAVLLGLLLMPGTARAECAEPVECAPGRKVSRCVICSDERCTCWFKRSEGSDIGCTNGCDCNSQASEVEAWCESEAPSGQSCGGVPVGAIALWAWLRRRRKLFVGTQATNARRARLLRFGSPLLLLPLVIAMALASASCAKQYVRVEASFPTPPASDAPLTVATATDEYKARTERAPLKTLVFRLPDNCFAADNAKFGAPVSLPRCTPWLSELEKAFRGEGYDVVSWAALRTLEQQKKLTPLLAARRLGAQVLVNFSELSITDFGGAGSSGAQLLFFHALPNGESTGTAQLTAGTEKALRHTIEDRLAKKSARRTRGQSAIAEFSAVLPDTGAWFITGKLTWTRPGAPAEPLAFLLRGRGEHWRPVWPFGLADDAASVERAPEPTPAQLQQTINTAATAIAQRFHAEADG